MGSYPPWRPLLVVGVGLTTLWLLVRSGPGSTAASGCPPSEEHRQQEPFLLPPLPEDPTAMAAALFSYIELPQRWCRRLVMLGGMATRGGAIDGHKFMCLDPGLAPDRPCLVYSLGGNNDWSFERAVIDTLGCEVHTFDPSLSPTTDVDTHGAVFHALGLGGADATNSLGWRLLTLTSLRRRLFHHRRTIHYLKVDVEGGEWAWLQHDVSSLQGVNQLGMEVHLGDMSRKALRRAYGAFLRLQGAGFRTVFSEVNRVYGRRFSVSGVAAAVGQYYEMVWVRPPADHRTAQTVTTWEPPDHRSPQTVTT